MGILETLTTKIAQKSHLKTKVQIAAHTYHLQLSLEKPLKNYVPEKQLKVFVGMGAKSNMSDFGRTYSVWNYNEEQLTIDIAACTFSDGPGAKWVADVQIGDLIYFSGPEGKFTLENTAENYLFLGDISTLGHLYEIARNLQPSQRYESWIYGSSSTDFFPDSFADIQFDFHTLEENNLTALQSFCKTLGWDAEKSLVYIGGESNFCIAMNKFFKTELQWPTKRIKNKPFWNPDKKGLE